MVRLAGQHADRPAASGPAWSRRSRIRPPAGPISARTTSACSTCPDRGSATWWDGPSTSTTEELRPGPWWPTAGPSSGAGPTRSTWSRRPAPPPGSPRWTWPAGAPPWSSRSVVDAGVLPDPEWFFGLEDFDFFCRVREAGFEVLVDDVAARQVAGQQTSSGREGALRHRRPIDDDEAWRSYYHARNSFALIRRHGRPGWYGWQLAFTARQLQKARSRAERAAIAHGFWDGALGRMGENPRYGRRVGEFEPGSRPRRSRPDRRSSATGSGRGPGCPAARAATSGGVERDQPAPDVVVEHADADRPGPGRPLPPSGRSMDRQPEVAEGGVQLTGAVGHAPLVLEDEQLVGCRSGPATPRGRGSRTPAGRRRRWRCRPGACPSARGGRGRSGTARPGRGPAGAGGCRVPLAGAARAPTGR